MLKITGHCRRISTMAKILLIEPFYTGSHKQLVDLLHEEIPDTSLYTLPGKKWHWRARTSALWLSQHIQRNDQYRTLFASSVLNLAELVALRPDLRSLHKVLYFHENQLCYPVQFHKERDFQYGYNQILSCLVADVVVFNSSYNMESFLNSIPTFLKLMPDYRPPGLAEQIKGKCKVLHFPIVFPEVTRYKNTDHVSESKHCSGCQSTSHFTNSVESVRSVDKGEMQTLSDCAQRCSSEQDVKCEKDILDDSVTSLEKGIISQRVTDEKLRQEVIHHKGANKNDAVQTAANEQAEASNNYHTSNSSSDTEYVNFGDEDKVKGFQSSGISADECERKRLKISNPMTDVRPLHIVWPHRWEHDKNPQTFFKVVTQLLEAGCDFRLSVLGENFQENPVIFEESYRVLKEKIASWGYQQNKHDYYLILANSDIVVSTSYHEFFGVAMLEAVHLGCYPLVPNRLVYPEIFSDELMYRTENQLFKKLKNFCEHPDMLRRKEIKVDTAVYSWNALKDQYMGLLTCSAV